MGSYVIRLKVLPADIATEHQRIVDSIASKLPPEARIRGHRVEPIAFGLSAVIVDVVAPEEEGSIDKVEQAVSTAEFVGQCEVQGVSRMSSTLHTT